MASCEGLENIHLAGLFSACLPPSDLANISFRIATGAGSGEGTFVLTWSPADGLSVTLACETDAGETGCLDAVLVVDAAGNILVPFLEGRKCAQAIGDGIFGADSSEMISGLWYVCVPSLFHLALRPPALQLGQRRTR